MPPIKFWINHWLTHWMTHYVYVKTQSAAWVISPQNHHQFSATICINLYYNFVLTNNNHRTHLDPNTCSRWHKTPKEIRILNQPLMCVAFHEEGVYFKFHVFFFILIDWITSILKQGLSKLTNCAQGTHLGSGKDNLRGVWTKNVLFIKMYFCYLIFFLIHIAMTMISNWSHRVWIPSLRCSCLVSTQSIISSVSSLHVVFPLSHPLRTVLNVLSGLTWAQTFQGVSMFTHDKAAGAW